MKSPITKPLAVAFLCLATPAVAQSVDAQDPQKLISLMQDHGLRARLDTDTTGDPKIVSSTSGTEFSVYFYGCEGGENCKTIQLSAGYDLDTPSTAAAMNSWNTNKRFGRAYIDDEGDPFIEYDINMEDGGILEANFIDSLEYWEAVVSDFEDFIDW